MLYLQCLTQERATGYGGAANNFLLELQRRQYPLVFGHYLDHLLNYMTSLEMLPDYLKPKLQIYFGQPYRGYEGDYFQRRMFDGEIRSLKVAPTWGCFTMFESNTLPEFWVEDINNRYKFDFLIVPSKWCQDIFVNSGIKCPVHYVPLGINPYEYPRLERPDRDMFVFLHRAFYLNDRKGGDLVIDAFQNLREKGELKKALLIVKTTPFITRHKGDIDLGPVEGVYFIHSNISHAAQLDLLRFADFGLHPTSGEGFGLMPLEEMATGLPVAVSNNTGCVDYLDAKINFPINCFLQPNWFRKIGGMEMRPDPDHVEELMLYAYNNRGELREMGKRAAEYVKENWSYEKATDKLIEVINQYV